MFMTSKGGQEKRGPIGLREAARSSFQVAIESISSKNRGESTYNLASNAVLAACSLAYPEKCDIKREVKKDFLPVLIRYLIAYNDWVDVGEDLPEESEFKQKFKEELSLHEKQLKDYLETMPDKTEADALTQAIEKNMEEVRLIEEHTKKIEQSDEEPEEVYRQVLKMKELVNAIETVLNIIACVDREMFTDRLPSDDQDITLEKLEEKYTWLTDPNFSDTELTPDEKKARMLYFAAMASQMQNDLSIYEYDKQLGIIKPINVLTDKVGLNLQEAKSRIKQEEGEYISLAKKHGFKRRNTIIGNALFRCGSDGVHALVDLARSRDPNSLTRRLIRNGLNKGGYVRQAVLVDRS